MRRLTATLLAAAAAGCALTAAPAAAAVPMPPPVTASERGWTLESVDRNGDEYVSLREFRDAWVQRGGSPGDAEKTFREADTDKNGYLCVKEWPNVSPPA